MLHLNCCSAGLLLYCSNELYLAWLKPDSALSAVKMLVEKLLCCEASPQGKIAFVAPQELLVGGPSANAVVSQPLHFSSSAWLQLMF